MARLLVLLLALFALAVTGCGEDEAKNPLDEALGYLPENAPFAVAIDTNVEGDQYEALDKIAEKFPFGDQVKQGLRRELEENGDVDFEKDVKPLLGNPFVVGAVDARSFTGEGEDNDFVAAVQAKDGDKLKDLVEKENPKEDGEKSGAKLYRDEDGDSFAIKDDVLIVAGSKRLLENGLEQREKDDRLDEETFEKGLEGLPEDSLLRVYGDVEALLESDPDAKDARKVEWVAALRTLGLTASAEQDEISIDFRLRTEGGELTEEDLPVAAGGEAPRIVRRKGEIGLGLRDPSQVVEFAEAAGRAVDPSGFGDFQRAKRQVEGRLGVDIDRDLVGQLTGDVSVNADVDGDFGLRAELKDPAEFERTLKKVADELPRIAENAGAGTVGLAKPKRGEDFYAIAQPDGESVVFGVVDRVLVVSNDPASAGRLASETPTEVRGAQGAIVLGADAERLADRVLQQLAPRIGLGSAFGGQLFTGPLGELTGSVAADEDGLKGRLRLGID
jgi:hypothetical protein